MRKFVSMFIASTAVAGLASACAVDSTGEAETGTSESALVCHNQQGTNAMIAAVAVAAAQELGRWKASTDFTLKTGTYNQQWVVLSSAGLKRCKEMGKPGCPNLTALLAFQDAHKDGQIRFPGGEVLSSWSYAARLVAGFNEQKVCEGRPSNNTGNPANCPAEEHLLKLAPNGIKQGGCDTNFTFIATTPKGGKLASPALLKNKLLWASGNYNPYIGFQSTASTVTIDPTWDLNPPGSQQGGSCVVSKQKFSTQNLNGACCKISETARPTKFVPMSTANMYKCNG